MNLVIVAFVLGAAAALRLTVMPDLALLKWALPLFCLGALLPGSRAVAALVLGAWFALAALDDQLDQIPPASLFQHPVQIEGVIEGLPRVRRHSTRFGFRVTAAPPELATRQLLLSRYAQGDRPEVPLAAGQHWRLSVRLRPARGAVNPGGFDYRAWLLTQGYGATGYVVEGRQLEPTGSRLIEGLRGRLRDRLESVLPATEVRGLLLALLVGDGSSMVPSQWRVLALTGTTHLLVISGLHVGLVAGLWFALLRWLPWAGASPGFGSIAAISCLVLGVAGAGSYAWVAGMGVPVQRALIMLLVVVLLLALRRFVSLIRAWLLGLLVVTLLNPLVSLAAGFWLSFGAVWLLMYAFAGRRRDPTVPGLSYWLLKLLQTQWAMLIGMAPLLWLWVGQVAPVAGVANLIAVPLVSLVIVPLLLGALVLVSFSLTLSGWLLLLADRVMAWLWHWLEWLAAQAWVLPAVPAGGLAWMLALVGVLVLLSPRGLMPRLPGVLMLMPLLGSAPPVPPAPGQVRVTVLDVGQGLGVLVQTRGMVLLYDTGPGTPDGFDAGAQVVAPYLRRQGIRRLDTLIVSHGDLDHAGGAEALRADFSIGLELLGEPEIEQLGCDGFWQWRLDGVQLTQWPVPVVDSQDRNKVAGNNRSCVLTIEAGGQRMLIPGDIDGAHELALLGSGMQPVDVLIAAHHGSRGSSHPGFLNRLAPKVVVVSAGYLSRFGHPHEETLQRYRARRMRVYNTADDGAITIELGGGVRVTTARRSAPRLWRGRNDAQP